MRSQNLKIKLIHLHLKVKPVTSNNTIKIVHVGERQTAVKLNIAKSEQTYNNFVDQN